MLDWYVFLDRSAYGKHNNFSGLIMWLHGNANMEHKGKQKTTNFSYNYINHHLTMFNSCKIWLNGSICLVVFQSKIASNLRHFEKKSESGDFVKNFAQNWPIDKSVSDFSWKDVIGGFHVTSYEANFASHRTRDRYHVAMLVLFPLPIVLDRKHNKMSKNFLFRLYSLNTKLQPSDKSINT